MSPVLRQPAGLRPWPLLFPLAYAVHLSEEMWGGPGFVAWISANFFPDLSLQRFLWINAVAWPAMLIAAVLATRSPRLRWLVVPLATIVGVNGLVHIGSMLLIGSYSPGVVSGTLVYLPLAGFALARIGREVADPRYRIGIPLGLALHGLVMVLAAGLIQLPG